MNPIMRDYLIYGMAIAVGFSVYLAAERLGGLDFIYAFPIGLVTIHGMVLIGRRIL